MKKINSGDEKYINKSLDTAVVKNITKTKLLVTLGVIFSFFLGMAFMGVLTISDDSDSDIDSSTQPAAILAGSQSYICGDVDGSGTLDISDPVYLVDWMFHEGPPPPEPLARVNVDGINGVDIADLVYLVGYMFMESDDYPLICENIIVNHISPADDVWVEDPGTVQFTCHANSTTDISEVSVIVREYYGGWELGKIIHNETTSMPGSNDVDFDFSSTVNLTHGLYTYECLATDIVGGNGSSGERNYKTGVGKVYIVHAVDTEPEKITNLTTPNILSYNVDMSSFLPGGNIESVMDNTWRNQYTDSLGNPNTFWWFMRSDEIICQSNEGCDAVADYLYLDDTFNFSEEINNFGDSLAWHYHNIDHYNYNQYAEGNSCPAGGCQEADTFWNQMQTFDGTTYREKSDVELAESVLARFIIESRFFPISYRAGWVWQDTDMSNWLEGFMPADYSNLFGYESSYDTVQPIENHYDWETAPGFPYHPSAENYLTKGNSDRVVIPCLPGSLSTNYIQNVFSLANQGANMILCHYSHNYGFNFLKGDVQDLFNNLDSVVSIYPNVQYIYGSDSDVIKGLFKITDDTAPIFTLEVSPDQNWLNITSSEELFRPPFLAIQSASDYYRGEVIEDSSTEWRFSIEGLDIIKAAVGGVDLGYNPGYAEIILP